MIWAAEFIRIRAEDLPYRPMVNKHDDRDTYLRKRAEQERLAAIKAASEAWAAVLASREALPDVVEKHGDEVAEMLREMIGVNTGTDTTNDER